MIFKNLWRRPMRSLLTILGIAIGVATVVSLGAMAEGMIKNYGTAVGGSNDLLVIQANALDALFSTLDEEMALRMQAIWPRRTIASSRASRSPARSRSRWAAAPPSR